MRAPEELCSPLHPRRAAIPAPRLSPQPCGDAHEVITYSLDAAMPSDPATRPRPRPARWLSSGRVTAATYLITIAAVGLAAAAGTHAWDTQRAHGLAAMSSDLGPNPGRVAPFADGTVLVPNTGPLPVRISGVRAVTPGISVTGPVSLPVVPAGGSLRLPVRVMIRCGPRMHRGGAPVAVSLRPKRGQSRRITVPLQVPAGEWAELESRSCAGGPTA